MFNVTPSSSAMYSLRQPSANGVTSTVFSSPHEHRISSTTGSVPDPLTLRLLPTGRAAPSRPFLLSTSQTLTRLCSQATHLPGHRHPQRQGGTEREPTARPTPATMVSLSPFSRSTPLSCLNPSGLQMAPRNQGAQRAHQHDGPRHRGPRELPTRARVKCSWLFVQSPTCTNFQPCPHYAVAARQSADLPFSTLGRPR